MASRWVAELVQHFALCAKPPNCCMNCRWTGGMANCPVLPAKRGAMPCEGTMRSMRSLFAYFLARQKVRFALEKTSFLDGELYWRSEPPCGGSELTDKPLTRVACWLVQRASTFRAARHTTKVRCMSFGLRLTMPLCKIHHATLSTFSLVGSLPREA